MSRIGIKASCLRDASFVLGNLGADDLAEVACQLPAGMLPQHLAPYHLALPKTAIAYVDDVPAMFFGVGALNAATASVWSIGTAKAWRAVPEATRYWHEHLIPWMLEQGFRNAEARSLAANKRTHGWLRSLGAEAVAEFPFGNQDEPFLLFRFTVARYRSIYGQLSSDEA